MTDSQVQTIVEELTQEQTRLQERLGVLKTELTRIESALTRVNGALDALRGSSKGRIRKPAATKQEVVQYIKTALSHTGAKKKGPLKEIVEQMLTENGQSRMGFALRFKEALRDPSFIETDAGVQLADRLTTTQIAA